MKKILALVAISIALQASGQLFINEQQTGFSNVVEVLINHEPNCALIRYVEGGQTNEFHSWMCPVVSYTNGTVILGDSPLIFSYVTNIVDLYEVITNEVLSTSLSYTVTTNWSKDETPWSLNVIPTGGQFGSGWGGNSVYYETGTICSNVVLNVNWLGRLYAFILHTDVLALTNRSYTIEQVKRYQ